MQSICNVAKQEFTLHTFCKSSVVKIEICLHFKIKYTVKNNIILSFYLVFVINSFQPAIK